MLSRAWLKVPPAVPVRTSSNGAPWISARSATMESATPGGFHDPHHPGQRFACERVRICTRDR